MPNAGQRVSNIFDCKFVFCKNVISKKVENEKLKTKKLMSEKTGNQKIDKCTSRLIVILFLVLTHNIKC